jgi:hypothetical protein
MGRIKYILERFQIPSSHSDINTARVVLDVHTPSAISLSEAQPFFYEPEVFLIRRSPPLGAYRMRQLCHNVKTIYDKNVLSVDCTRPVRVG